MNLPKDRLNTAALERLVVELERRLARREPIDARELSRRFALPQSDVELCVSSLTALDDMTQRPSGTPKKGQKIGGYEVLEALGHGGMGLVFRARDTDLGRSVALKLIRGGKNASAQLIRRFAIEGRAMARLRHPNIVTVYAVGNEAGQAWIAMQLVEGESLESNLAREGRLGPERAIEVAATLAHALAHAHSQGVLHRDIKPHNIVMSKAGKPMLTDFGLAKQMRCEVTAMTRFGEFLGTIGYVSPEQARGASDEVDERTDVYGLGACLYHMITGIQPYFSDLEKRKLTTAAGDRAQPGLLDKIMQIVEQAPASPSAIAPHLNEHKALEELCLRCLEKAPAQRFESMTALASALEALRAESRQQQGLERARSPLASRLTLIAAGALLGLPIGVELSGGAKPTKLIGRSPKRVGPASSPSSDLAELGAALIAKDRAERAWRHAPEAVETRQALFEQALKLGALAQRAHLAALSQRCFDQARDLGVDRARVDALRERTRSAPPRR